MMDFSTGDTLIRITVPLLVAWNVFLFRQNLHNKDKLHQFQLHVVEFYTSKKDLERMMQRLEEQLEKQLNNFFNSVNKGK